MKADRQQRATNWHEREHAALDRRLSRVETALWALAATQLAGVAAVVTAVA